VKLLIATKMSDKMEDQITTHELIIVSQWILQPTSEGWILFHWLNNAIGLSKHN